MADIEALHLTGCYLTFVSSKTPGLSIPALSIRRVSGVSVAGDVGRFCGPIKWQIPAPTVLMNEGLS
ncbi:hypothetical protein MPL3365_170328 [Mesorhizobium plurifarium]|uniref:Uncharacterized protein n=1 Tax=Mesorhizobium plurifarium TaxID=69974 RepID=A0A090FZI4_MESPL|nr:hypothetical protein MPL3365_170328 [Mesorhizobium plurifarium]